jgi:hypothetical protein
VKGLGVPNERFLFAGVKGQVFVAGAADRLSRCPRRHQAKIGCHPERVRRGGRVEGSAVAFRSSWEKAPCPIHRAFCDGWAAHSVSPEGAGAFRPLKKERTEVRALAGQKLVTHPPPKKRVPPVPRPPRWRDRGYHTHHHTHLKPRASSQKSHPCSPVPMFPPPLFPGSLPSGGAKRRVER